MAVLQADFVENLTPSSVIPKGRLSCDAARPGIGISEAATLHWTEESFLRQEVEASGFRLLAAEGDFLRNPDDPKDKNTPDPPQPKDEFVLKFVKP
jgi:predicted methyltransferase